MKYNILNMGQKRIIAKTSICIYNYNVFYEYLLLKIIFILPLSVADINCKGRSENCMYFNLSEEMRGTQGRALVQALVIISVQCHLLGEGHEVCRRVESD